MSNYMVKARLLGDALTRRNLAYEFEDQAMRFGATKVTPSDDHTLVTARFDFETADNARLSEAFAAVVKEIGAIEEVTAKRLYSYPEALAAMAAGGTTNELELARA